MTFTCFVCGTDSGTSLVCRFCRRTMKPTMQKKVSILWHELIRSQAPKNERGQLQCYHCKGWFAPNKICGDHFPKTKAAAPELRYDVTAGVTSCAACNTSGSPHRVSPVQKPREPVRRPKKATCKVLHCVLIPAANGLCVLHRKA